MKRLAIALGAALVALPALAQSPSEGISNQKLISDALEDIRHMSRDEAIAFRDFMAECTDDTSKNEVVRHQCDVAMQKYTFEYYAMRSLDRLMASMRFFVSTIRESPTTTTQDVKTYAQILQIKIALQQALRQQFLALRRGNAVDQK